MVVSKVCLASCVVALVVGGCSTVDVSRAVRIDAFGPDGTNTTGELSEEQVQAIEEHGVVIELQEGDVLHVHPGFGGDVLELVEGGSLQVKVLQKLFVYTGPGGLLFSKDGETFVGYEDFFDGSLQVGLSVKKESKQNDVQVGLHVTTE